MQVPGEVFGKNWPPQSSFGVRMTNFLLANKGTSLVFAFQPVPVPWCSIRSTPCGLLGIYTFRVFEFL